jgi:ATP-dependent RNA helicase DDX10/DBP4
MRRPKRRGWGKQSRLREVDEIALLNEWIEAGKPRPGTKPPPPSKSAGAGPAPPAAGEHPEYGACTRFDELPLSQKTKDALRKNNFTEMSEIQRAALPHALCGRDVLGAAKTGSGKTLAFIIPVRLSP